MGSFMNKQTQHSAAVREKGLDLPPQIAVMQILSGLTFSMVIKSALEVGVFRVLKEGIYTLDKMAVSLKVNPAALKRLLRALCSVGLLYEDRPNQYNVTKLGATLQPRSNPRIIRVCGSIFIK